jgi:hypothetical protein
MAKNKCNPAKWQILRYAKTPTMQEVFQAAYRATEKFIIPNAASYKDHYQREWFMNLWAVGPQVFNMKHQSHPLVMGRWLIMHYARFYMGYKLKQAAGIFGKDHTTAIHASKGITYAIRSKHDDYLRDAWNEFLNQLKFQNV